jgi:hypothetical protein
METVSKEVVKTSGSRPQGRQVVPLSPLPPTKADLDCFIARLEVDFLHLPEPEPISGVRRDPYSFD